ncbi:MAG: glycosyltransferase [Phycisphaerae bacterium]|jgi:glycosyltransferase involved in cell wall biosynthesis
MASFPSSPEPRTESDNLPFVSIVVAVRNEARHLPEVLDLLFRQDYPADRLEVILVDGVSDDNSVAVANRYIAQHPTTNARIVNNPRRITPCAFNVGIRAARGEIIAIFGAHAAYHPDYISQSVEILCRNSNNVACAGGIGRLMPGADYRTRSTIGDLARWAHDYGYFHFSLARICPAAAILKYFLPGVAVSGLLLVTLAAIFLRPAAWLLAIGAAGYTLATIAASVHIALTRPGAAKGLLYMPLLFAVLHFSYGIGVIRGYFHRFDQPPEMPPAPPQRDWSNGSGLFGDNTLRGTPATITSSGTSLMTTKPIPTTAQAPSRPAVAANDWTGRT